MVQTPAQPIRAVSTPGSRWTVYVLRPVWLARREIALSLLLLAALGCGWTVGGWPLALMVALSLASLLVMPGVRGAVGALLWRARVIRRWDSAARYAGLATHNDRVPRVMGVTRTAAGERLRVRLPKGSAAVDVEDRVPWLTSSLRASAVRVAADEDNAQYATVEVIRRDPLDAFGVLTWPWAAAAEHGWVSSAWEPIPVAVAENGDTVMVALLGGSAGGSAELAGPDDPDGGRRR
ncbi:hypothetical protein [Nonomuraea sp. NPDC049725]|uniref:hypothetical protein n=1 Tax=Nonomuraea sp. NPDC049725 TaxID=3154508 RepID=UPI003426D95A